MKILVTGAFAAALILSGCATVQYGPMQTVVFSTEPQGALCYGTPNSDSPKFIIRTPATVSLLRSSAPIRVICKLDGYKDIEGVINEKWIGFFDNVLGNVWFGILPGMLVDAVSGANHELTPEKFVITLEPLTAK